MNYIRESHPPHPIKGIVEQQTTDSLHEAAGTVCDEKHLLAMISQLC